MIENIDLMLNLMGLQLCALLTFCLTYCDLHCIILVYVCVKNL